MPLIQNWILKLSEITFKRIKTMIRKLHREKICSRQEISDEQTEERIDGRTVRHTY